MFLRLFTIVSQALVLSQAFLWFGTFLWAHMRSFCSYPVVASTFRSCDTINSNLTVWAALPLLLGAQTTGLEQVINHTDAHIDIIMDLTETRIASLDLSILVQFSTLEYRDQIAMHINKVADDALDLNRALQILSAKVGAGFDRIVSTNDHLYRVLRASSATAQPASDSVRCQVGPLFQGLDIRGCLPHTSYPDISHAYDRALQTYETVLRELIQTSISSLTKATAFDADLVAVMSIIGGEKLEIDITKKQLGRLWTLLGGNNYQLTRLARNEQVLDRVGEYSARSLRYVRSIQDTLENMQRQLEELRLVASGALISDVAPPEVVLEMLARGLERLGNARAAVGGGRIQRGSLEGL
ncbi:uncharacterized protein B0H18DRAFT_1121011 [Fomitopsis serialis]|uniref:uncharacterized protein n=1 Tax=Fomitopsis serialis TaxID=139415 RepID=UPI0020084B1A|nr:uncharacterized protein B0H18DRAFT_1121011 [Neoantrodia serialis]KAH9922186.1 hypothetical protein B0H18DRAFT_1121011 [Neoantrodia serialis]